MPEEARCMRIVAGHGQPRKCGRLSRQVRIDGQEDDEALMEFFL